MTAAAQVHQQGGTAIDLTLGKTGIGVMGGAGYMKNFSDNAYLQLRGVGEFGRMYNFRYSHFGLDAMAFYNPFYLSDFFQFNAGAGLTIGYEKISGITKEKSNGIGFMAGLKAGANIEAFLSDQMSFYIYGNQAYLVKKSLGTTYYEVGLGIRIFLNNYY
ncbi:conjugal transfer protein TraO [Chitinophaga polysaccharea]|nr:conjugal transfer protein TraO [Chitinophaga polysaccharea]